MTENQKRPVPSVSPSPWGGGRGGWGTSDFKRAKGRSHIAMQRKLPDSTITVPIPDHKELSNGTLLLRLDLDFSKQVDPGCSMIEDRYNDFIMYSNRCGICKEILSTPPVIVRKNSVERFLLYNSSHTDFVP